MSQRPSHWPLLPKTPPNILYIHAAQNLPSAFHNYRQSSVLLYSLSFASPYSPSFSLRRISCRHVSKHIKSPYCFHSKGESTFSAVPPCFTGILRCRPHPAAPAYLIRSQPGTLTRANPSLPTSCPRVQCEAPRRIHMRFLRAPLISRQLSVRVSRILLALFQAFRHLFHLIAILCYLWIFVKPKIGPPHSVAPSVFSFTPQGTPGRFLCHLLIGQVYVSFIYKFNLSIPVPVTAATAVLPLPPPGLPYHCIQSRPVSNLRPLILHPYRQSPKGRHTGLCAIELLVGFELPSAISSLLARTSSIWFWCCLII